jgi:hypothetical protein
MHERDYVMRMIEQMGQALIRLRQIIFGGESVAEARRKLQSEARTFGMDLDLARAATPDTLRLLVSTAGETDPTRTWLLAEMLYLDGLAHEEEDVDRARASYDTALRLLALVEPGGSFLVGWPMATDRIEDIHARLDDLDRETAPGPDGETPVGPARRVTVRRGRSASSLASGTRPPDAAVPV